MVNKNKIVTALLIKATPPGVSSPLYIYGKQSIVLCLFGCNLSLMFQKCDIYLKVIENQFLILGVEP